MRRHAWLRWKPIAYGKTTGNPSNRNQANNGATECRSIIKMILCVLFNDMCLSTVCFLNHLGAPISLILLPINTTPIRVHSTIWFCCTFCIAAYRILDRPPRQESNRVITRSSDLHKSNASSIPLSKKIPSTEHSIRIGDSAHATDIVHHVQWSKRSHCVCESEWKRTSPSIDLRGCISILDIQLSFMTGKRLRTISVSYTRSWESL